MGKQIKQTEEEEPYYNEDYDAYYNIKNNIWLEKKCPNRNSDVNSKRPLTPKQAKKENKKYPYRKLGRREKERFK